MSEAWPAPPAAASHAWAYNAEAAAILFLVRFERRHRQDIQSAAFRATDHSTVFKDIHLAQRKGGGMCIQAGGEPNV
jgi:hypothetical protein